jgi:hypothetical protein
MRMRWATRVQHCHRRLVLASAMRRPRESVTKNLNRVSGHYEGNAKSFYSHRIARLRPTTLVHGYERPRTDLVIDRGAVVISSQARVSGCRMSHGPIYEQDG